MKAEKKTNSKAKQASQHTVPLSGGRRGAVIQELCTGRL